MSAASRYNDLTLQELFQALKKRLYGLSANCTRYAAPHNIWRTRVRTMALICTTSSNSSGLFIREVRDETGDKNRQSLIKLYPFR